MNVVSSALFALTPSGASQCERAVRVGEVAGVDLRAAVDQQRRDHQKDQEQDQPRRSGVRPVEP
jgi:hypothetical protein